MKFTPTLRFFRRNAVARVKPDPADLGTCFGMEASLEVTPSDFQRSPPTYALESQGQPPQQESPLSWLNRRA